jgi:glycosyltransferase involved in cell wall biosynthesis
MKILIVTNYYPPYDVGGYELRCKETAEELKQRGHDVLVLTSKRGSGSSLHQEKVFRSLFVNSLDSLDEPQLADPFRFYQRYGELKWAIQSRRNYGIAFELIRSASPDLVFIWNLGRIGVAPVLAAQKLNIPVVFSVGDYWLLHIMHKLCNHSNPVKRQYWAAILGLDDFHQLDLRHLIMNSEALKQAYIKNGFQAENIRVIPRGIKADLILPIPKVNEAPRSHSGPIRLLFVGRIVPEKGPEAAINAVEILRKKYGENDIKFDFVGDGPQKYISSLMNMISHLKLENNVRFRGKLDRSAVLDLYLDYDALLFPYRWDEPFGGTVLEAMARGLPVIISSHGGPVDMVCDGETGLLVPVDEPTKFAEAVERLVQDPVLADRLRRAALQTIRQKYTLENVVDRTLEYLQSVVN